MNADEAYALLERIKAVLEAELDRLARDGRGSAEVEYLNKGIDEMLAWLEKF